MPSISDFRLHFENKWKNKKNHQKKVNIASQYLEQCHLLLKFCCLFCPLICNSLKGKKQWHSIKNIDINVKKQVHTNFTITKLKTLRHWIPSLWNTHPYTVCGFFFLLNNRIHCYIIRDIEPATENEEAQIHEHCKIPPASSMSWTWCVVLHDVIILNKNNRLLLQEITYRACPYITCILARTVDASTALCSSSTSLSIAAYFTKQKLS